MISVDVLYIVDVSVSDDQRLQTIKEFILNSAGGVSVGQDGGHVAIITYGGGEAKIEWDFKE